MTGSSISLPRPSPAGAAEYLRRWNENEQYRLQEAALDRLFLELCPQNRRIEDILIKAAALNDFYSTGIFSIFPAAQHILALDIDARLSAGDLSLVGELARVEFRDGKVRRLYSFATKYCSRHAPLVYPIYDEYVSRTLRWYRDADGFCRFTAGGLKDYHVFHQVLLCFRRHYGLEDYTLKEIDQYLWQLGKQSFPPLY